jgi:hypothetical protein
LPRHGLFIKQLKNQLPVTGYLARSARTTENTVSFAWLQLSLARSRMLSQLHAAMQRAYV